MIGAISASAVDREVMNMKRSTIIIALLVGLFPLGSVHAAGFYSIEGYRSWGDGHRLGFVMGTLDTMYLVTEHYIPDGYEKMKRCLQKKTANQWATEIDAVLLNYDPPGRYDTDNMTLPEYVEWAFEYSCDKQ